jgi:hypothetical protein
MGCVLRGKHNETRNLQPVSINLSNLHQWVILA